MEWKISKTNSLGVEDLRSQFLAENNFQFIHNKCHEYGWADVYLFASGNQSLGYGAVWGKYRREDRDCIFEFYLKPPFREFADEIFNGLITISKPQWIECQSNDLLLSSLFFGNAVDIHAEAVLFAECYTSSLRLSGTSFRKNSAPDHPAGSGEYVLEHNGEAVASGGFLMNYNFPYADIYMDVKEDFRKQGFGSFIIQELKKEIYHAGRVPAARCNIRNLASKRALLKAGFTICGLLLAGKAGTMENGS